MKIVKTYSHLNGLEYLMVHRQNLWREVESVIADVDAGVCRTKEVRMQGELKFSPIEMNRMFAQRLEAQA